MKRSVIAILGFCVILSYQNCGRAPIADGNNNSLNNPTEVMPVEKIDVAQTRVIEVPENPYLEAQLQVPVQNAKPTSTLASHHLAIDVKTGVIEVLDQNQEKVDGLQYCLNAQDLQNLSSILAASQICEDKAVVDEHLQCTMEYRFPYARLHFLDAEVPLGESMSGCHSGPDLCGVQKDRLQGLLGEIQAHLPEKSCNFEVVAR